MFFEIGTVAFINGSAILLNNEPKNLELPTAFYQSTYYFQMHFLILFFVLMLIIINEVIVSIKHFDIYS